MSVGYFYPDIVGNGNASISDATQKLNNVANKINICNSALDSRIKSRLSYNLGNIANQVSKLSDKTQNYHTKVNDVVQEYYKIMAETSGMTTNASFLFGDILDVLKGALSGDVLALGDNFISALSTFLTVNNGQTIAQNILASGMQFVGNVANGIQGGLQNFTDDVYAMWQETQATVINGAQTVNNWWNDFTNSVVTEFNNFQVSVANAFNDAKVTVIDTVNNVGGVVSKLVDDFTNSEIGQTIISIGNALIDAGTTVISSAGTSLLGVVNGLGNIVEDVVDLGALAVGAVATVPAAAIDLGAYLISGEGASAIDSVWEGVQSFVQEKYVDNAFDYFFNETSIGNFLNEHTIDVLKYESGGYELIKGASYIVGTIALAVATAGSSAAVSGASTAGKAGSLALNLSKAQNIGKAGSAISFATGTSRGAEEAWNSGATTLEGISYGLLNGAWEGSQWLLGSKFAGLGLKTVGVDILSGAADIPLRTAFQGLYSDKNYVERFEDNGGVSGILLNTTLAGLLSGAGELPMSKQFFGTDAKAMFTTESNFDSLPLNEKVELLRDKNNWDKFNNFEKETHANFKSGAYNEEWIASASDAEKAKVWSEGNKSLEIFLNWCWKNDIKTTNCCKGGHPDEIIQQGYVSFEIDDSNIEKLSNLVGTGAELHIYEISDGVYNIAARYAPENRNQIYVNIIDNVESGKIDSQKVELLKSAFEFQQKLNQKFDGNIIYISLADTASLKPFNFNYNELSQKLNNLFQQSNTTIVNNNSWTSALFPNKFFISDIDLSNTIKTINWFNENIDNLKNIKVNETGAVVLDNSMPVTNNIFNIQAAKEGKTIGVDQGGIRVLKHNSLEFKRLRQKLKNLVFSSADATKILTNLDNPGACTYADVCNEIVNTFKNNAERFEEIFGYPMYMDGELNGNELLLDLYTFVNSVSNGGRLFEKVGNKYKIIDNRKGGSFLEKKGPLFGQQVYLSHLLNGKNIEAINRFLKSHDPNLSYEVEYLGHRLENYTGNYSKLTGEKMITGYDAQTGQMLKYDINQLKEKIETAINNGQNVSISVGKTNYLENPTLINMITGEEYYLNNGAHAMFVIDTFPDGLLVDSWGKPYIITWENLQYIDFVCSASTFSGI